jgi:hypothetical protein
MLDHGVVVQNKHYYTFTFSVDVHTADDTLYFAYCYPYSYTDLQVTTHRNNYTTPLRTCRYDTENARRTTHTHTCTSALACLQRPSLVYAYVCVRVCMYVWIYAWCTCRVCVLE